MAQTSVRQILLQLGMGDYNATQCIPTMLMAPAQTDPQMSQIVLITKAFQRVMAQMGASAMITGSIDASWSPYFAALAGPLWTNIPWVDLATALLEARRNGLAFQASYDAPIPGGAREYTLSGLSGTLDDLVPGFLPAVPGGILTYAVGGFLLLRHLKKRKR